MEEKQQEILTQILSESIAEIVEQGTNKKRIYSEMNLECLEKNKLELIELSVKWNGKEYQIFVSLEESIIELKAKICEVTKVLPKRQKIMGLTSNGKLPADEVKLRDLKVSNKKKIIVMGTPEENLINWEEYGNNQDVINDLDYDYTITKNDLINHQKIKDKLYHIISKTTITFINPPRKDKKLLVLDLDYTLLDMKCASQVINEMMRPHVIPFLTALFPKYDFAIWSQTNWKWLEMKITEMGLLTNPNFYISFVLDKSTMFTITVEKSGEKIKHQVKPLEVIWKKISYFNNKNTIHIDDLSRNFALNPQNGLKVTPYKKQKGASYSDDKELKLLIPYLLKIAEFDDLSVLQHSKWRDYVKE